MILDELENAMRNLPKTISSINKMSDKDRPQIKLGTIEYAIETLVQYYMREHFKLDNLGVIETKKFLKELQDEL